MSDLSNKREKYSESVKKEWRKSTHEQFMSEKRKSVFARLNSLSEEDHLNLELMEEEEGLYYRGMEEAEEDSRNFFRNNMMREFEQIEAVDEDEKEKSVKKRNGAGNEN